MDEKWPVPNATAGGFLGMFQTRRGLGTFSPPLKSGELAITVHPSLSRLAKPSADEVERPVRRIGESRCYSQLAAPGHLSRLSAYELIMLSH